MAASHPPDLGARLLLTERAALLPILRRTPADAFDRPTVCAGWTVRDVLARCGSALSRALLMSPSWSLTSRPWSG
jgi:hypothetical protein